MRIGIISEGTEDQAVISNLLKGIAKELNISELEVKPIRPDLGKSVSHLNDPLHKTIGTFQGVKNSCSERYDFEDFFMDLDNQFVVIHLDTAEIEKQDFIFQKPVKEANENYCMELRNRVIELINKWLENDYQGQILYAIAIEEIEAWVLTIYEKRNSSFSADAKSRLEFVLKMQSIDFDKVTKDFKKPKKLDTFLEYNQSLNNFVVSVKEVLSKIV